MRPGPRSPRWEAGLIVGHELNLPHAAQEGPAVQNTCWRELKACFAIEKASNRLLNAQCVPSHSKGCDREKKKKNSFEDRKGVILRGRCRMRAPSSVMTETVFISSRVVMEENHHQMENVFSILIAMEANQNQLQI